jgi:CheY-like chemotaxis protein
MLFYAMSMLRILVVDDQPSVLMTQVMVLQKQGYVATGASTFSGALELLESELFDVLLCDFGLDAGHNGLDLIEIAQSKQTHIRSILLTGYYSPELAEKVKQQGVLLLVKPVHVSELLSTLEQSLGAQVA